MLWCVTLYKTFTYTNIFSGHRLHGKSVVSLSPSSLNARWWSPRSAEHIIYLPTYIIICAAMVWRRRWRGRGSGGLQHKARSTLCSAATVQFPRGPLALAHSRGKRSPLLPQTRHHRRQAGSTRQAKTRKGIDWVTWIELMATMDSSDMDSKTC